MTKYVKIAEITPCECESGNMNCLNCPFCEKINSNTNEIKCNYKKESEETE